MKNPFLFLLIFLNLHSYAQKVKHEIFATGEQAVGNIAFTHQGQLVYSHHPFFNPTFRVVKYDAKNQSTLRIMIFNKDQLELA